MPVLSTVFERNAVRMDFDNLDLDAMTRSELTDLLARLDQLYDSHQALEPEDEDSDEYDEWEEYLEDLDDLIDDIRDRLDDL